MYVIFEYNRFTSTLLPTAYDLLQAEEYTFLLTKPFNIYYTRNTERKCAQIALVLTVLLFTPLALRV
jgi:hypothetical protein